MRLRSLWTIPSHLAMAGFAGVFLTFFDIYLEQINRLPVPILAVNLCLLVIVFLGSGTLLQAAGSEAMRTRLFTLFRANGPVLLPLAAVVSMSFLSAFQQTAYLDEGPRYVLYPAYEAAVVAFSMLLPFPAHRRAVFRWYLLVALAVTIGSVLADVANPGTFSMVGDRAAGFARNPNGAGFLLISLCCGVLSFERVRPSDLAVLAMTTAAVVATLSRGAVGLLAFLVTCYVVSIVRHARHRGIGTIAGYLAAFGSLVAVTVVAVNMMLGQRMFTQASRVAMLLGRERVVGPRESRVQLLQYAWDLVRDSPFLGYGSGFTATTGLGPHNIYIARWLDNGLIGVVCFVWLLAAMGVTFWKRRYTTGLVFTGVVVVEGFFSHNLMEERAFIVVLGMFLTLSFFSTGEPLGDPAKAGWRATVARRPDVRPAMPATRRSL